MQQNSSLLRHRHNNNNNNNNNTSSNNNQGRNHRHPSNHRMTLPSSATTSTTTNADTDIDFKTTMVATASAGKRQGGGGNQTSFQSLFVSQAALCTIPIWVLVVVSSLDNADKQLLASSFPMLEQTLQLDVSTLGYFSMFTNVSYALSLPFWGYCVHAQGIEGVHTLLAAACIAWGIATIGIALSSSSVIGQAIFRAVVGFALGSILPLSQTMLVELLIDTPDLRGRAFGLMGLCEKLAGTLAAASVVYLGERWEIPYYGLGAFSLLMSILVWYALHPERRQRRRSGQVTTNTYSRIGQSTMPTNKKKTDGGGDGDLASNVEFGGTVVDDTAIMNNQEKGQEIYNDEYMPESTDYDGNTTTTNTISIQKSTAQQEIQEQQEQQQLTLYQIIHRIIQLPAFMCMVAQGIFGGTPWDMMSFLLLLMDWRNFTKEQVVLIQFSSGITSTFGGWLGGILGDYANQNLGGIKGRILLAICSVLGGIPLYGLYLYSKQFIWAILWYNLFNIWASWTPSGALRPICADLTCNPSERAQIISLWIVLEKLSGAILGAPLVGYLTSSDIMSATTDNEENTNANSNEANKDDDKANKAQSLAFYLFWLSTLFWTLCAVFWIVMAMTLHKNTTATRSTTHHHHHQYNDPNNTNIDSTTTTMTTIESSDHSQQQQRRRRRRHHRPPKPRHGGHDDYSKLDNIDDENDIDNNDNNDSVNKKERREQEHSQQKKMEMIEMNSLVRKLLVSLLYN